MQTTTPPAVEVITAGTDWPGIAAAIATVIAAVLGIWFTARQGERARTATAADLAKRLTAEDNRALVGDLST